MIKKSLDFFFKQAVSFVRFAVPFALRLFVFVAICSLRVAFLAVISMFKGIPHAAEVIAEDWTRRAIDAGFPYLWEVYLFNIFYVLAICTILGGWMVIYFMSFFTVYIALSIII